MIIRATFDADGFVTGFYPADAWPSGYPETAIEISEEQWSELLSNPGSRKFENGEVVEYTPPPTPITVNDYRNAIQLMIDTKANERQYDSGATLASYVNSTQPEWAAEAKAFVAWRDQVWAYALAELDRVQSGERDRPTVETFLNELPAFEWPS